MRDQVETTNRRDLLRLANGFILHGEASDCEIDSYRSDPKRNEVAVDFVNKCKNRMKWLGLSINIKKPCLGRIFALGRVAVAVIKMQCIMLYK